MPRVVSPGEKLVDVVTLAGEPTGRRTSLDEAAAKGLPFRGAHVAVMTPDGKLLIEKRSHTIVTNPDRLDIGLGGVVDAGEEPMATAVRELHEETGLRASREDLTYLGRRHYNHFIPHLSKHLNVLQYNYLLITPVELKDLKLQTKEVSSVHLISMRRAHWLVRYHRLASLGRLASNYAYYTWLLKAIKTASKR